MSTEPSPRAEQIQANVAAALSRLRGEPASGAPQNTAPTPHSTLTQSVPLQASPLPGRPEAPSADNALAGTGLTASGLTSNEPLFPSDAPPAPKPMSVSMGVPDPSMALGGGIDSGGRQPTPFERLTGLKADPHLAVDTDDQPDLLQGIGVAPPPLADLPDADEEAQRRKRRLRNRLMLGGAAVVLLGGFWMLSGGGETDPQEVPVIAADGSPERVKPEEEGGLSVPNQDVAILNNGDEATAAQPETVLPAPEQPAAPPAPPPVVEQPAPEQPVSADPAAPAAATDPAAGGASTIPSVSAPDVTAIPSVPAPTELGVPATETAAPATEQAAPSAAAEQPAAPQPATEAAAQEAALPTVSAAVQPVPGGSARIQLASVKSEESARAEWARLQKANPAILGGLDLHIERFEKSAGDVYYRIQAGPLGDKASAKQICEQLKQKNQACIVAK